MHAYNANWDILLKIWLCYSSIWVHLPNIKGSITMYDLSFEIPYNSLFELDYFWYTFGKHVKNNSRISDVIWDCSRGKKKHIIYLVTAEISRVHCSLSMAIACFKVSGLAKQWVLLWQPWEYRTKVPKLWRYTNNC